MHFIHTLNSQPTHLLHRPQLACFTQHLLFQLISCRLVSAQLAPPKHVVNDDRDLCLRACVCECSHSFKCVCVRV